MIASGGPGNRLHEWIIIESGTEASACASPRASEEATPDETLSDRTVNALNERERWGLSQIEQGVKLQIRNVINHFGCSSATARRVLAGLKDQNMIRFVGATQAGYYHVISDLVRVAHEEW